MVGPIDWLLDGDLSIRWQVQCQLLDAPIETQRATQSLVAAEGWGDRLLSLRSESGRGRPGSTHANYSGKVWFTMEGGRGPSRWNTMRAMRVLRWCEGRRT